MPSNGWKNTPPLRKSKDLIDRSSSWQNFDTILSWATHFLVFCLADGNVCIFGLAVLFGIARLGNLVFHLDRTWRSFWLFLFFHQTYMSPTRLTIFHCALGLRMQASGPANPFSTENCFVWRYSPQIRRAQARLPLFLSHPAEFGVFFEESWKLTQKLWFLMRYYAMKSFVCSFTKKTCIFKLWMQHVVADFAGKTKIRSCDHSAKAHQQHQPTRERPRPARELARTVLHAFLLLSQDVWAFFFMRDPCFIVVVVGAMMFTIWIQQISPSDARFCSFLIFVVVVLPWWRRFHPV